MAIYIMQVHHIISDVTKVGVAQCGKLEVSPIFSSKKLTTFFSHRPLKGRLVTTPTLSTRRLICPVFSVNSATKTLNLIRVSPGAVCPPSAPLNIITTRLALHGVCICVQKM